MYPKIHLENSIPVGNTDSLIEEDYVLNKMKGLLYGYYIGANLSSTKEQVQKLDTLREILNIFHPYCLAWIKSLLIHRVIG